MPSPPQPQPPPCQPPRQAASAGVESGMVVAKSATAATVVRNFPGTFMFLLLEPRRCPVFLSGRLYDEPAVQALVPGHKLTLNAVRQAALSTTSRLRASTTLGD